MTTVSIYILVYIHIYIYIYTCRYVKRCMCALHSFLELLVNHLCYARYEYAEECSLTLLTKLKKLQNKLISPILSCLLALKTTNKQKRDKNQRSV